MLAYHRTYAMLKRAGHSQLKAHQILLDAMRGDYWALEWIKSVRKLRHSILEWTEGKVNAELAR